MKIKQVLIFLFCFDILLLSSCDINSNFIGDKIMPKENYITTRIDTFQIMASTVKRDSLFAKTTTGLLGEYFDPLYGRLNADFLCQFYCMDDYKFYKTPYENTIDSIYLALYYYGTGDPNSPFQFQIFPINKELDRAYFTNIDPADYCDLKDLWGSAVFTAASGSLEDSISNVRRIEIQLPKQLGQKIYDETINNPESFKSQQSFNEFFPGIYVTTGYGQGCLFNILRTDLVIKYKSIEKSSADEDSTIYCTEMFITTKEVIQLNRFENFDTEQLLAENEDYTYIKTPAGIYTRLVIPSQEMKSVIEGRIINSMFFSVSYMPNEDWPFALGPPSHLLLLPEDSLSTFFQNRYVENNLTSFISVAWNESSQRPETSLSTSQGYSPSKRTYYFNNIAVLLAYHISVSPDDDLRLLLVPVNRGTSGSSSSGYYTTEISNYLAPSGVKLRKDYDMMKVSIITSEFKK